MSEAGVGSVYAKIALVMGELKSVPKNGYNEFHKYAYVRGSDLSELVRPVMAKFGLCLIPNVISVESVATKTAYNKDAVLITVNMDFILGDETGATVKTRMVGQAEDTGDKALYKAYSGAMKYFLIQTFSIGSEDDPELDKLQGNNGQQNSGYQNRNQQNRGNRSSQNTPPQNRTQGQRQGNSQGQAPQEQTQQNRPQTHGNQQGQAPQGTSTQNSSPQGAPPNGDGPNGGGNNPSVQNQAPQGTPLVQDQSQQNRTQGQTQGNSQGQPSQGNPPNGPNGGGNNPTAQNQAPQGTPSVQSQQNQTSQQTTPVTQDIFSFKGLVKLTGEPEICKKNTSNGMMDKITIKGRTKEGQVAVVEGWGVEMIEHMADLAIDQVLIINDAKARSGSTGSLRIRIESNNFTVQAQGAA